MKTCGGCAFFEAAPKILEWAIDHCRYRVNTDVEPICDHPDSSKYGTCVKEECPLLKKAIRAAEEDEK